MPGWPTACRCAARDCPCCPCRCRASTPSCPTASSTTCLIPSSSGTRWCGWAGRARRCSSWISSARSRPSGRARSWRSTPATRRPSSRKISTTRCARPSPCARCDHRSAREASAVSCASWPATATGWCGVISRGGSRKRRRPEPLLGDVEAKVADLPVPHDVVLAFQPELALLAHRGHRAVGGDQLVVAHHLGTDEAARDVGMNGARGILGTGAPGDGPGPHLGLTHREEGEEAEERVAVAQHALDGGLRQAEVGKESRLLLACQL